MLLDAAAPVSRFGVRHHLTRVADRLQIAGDDFVERRSFRAGDLDDAASRRRERHIGNDGSNVVRRDRLLPPAFYRVHGTIRGPNARRLRLCMPGTAHSNAITKSPLDAPLIDCVAAFRVAGPVRVPKPSEPIIHSYLKHTGQPGTWSIYNTQCSRLRRSPVYR
jgi:hypothetical protein